MVSLLPADLLSVGISIDATLSDASGMVAAHPPDFESHRLSGFKHPAVDSRGLGIDGRFSAGPVDSWCSTDA